MEMYNNRVVVNGKVYNVPSGSSVSVQNGVVFVDGRRVTDQINDKIVQVEVHWSGPLAALTVEGGSVRCQDVHGPVQADGSVQAGNVGGDVRAGGSVTCEGVAGNVQAGGSVKCGSVGGKVQAGGSVRHG